jgi:hypothetical protein
MKENCLLKLVELVKFLGSFLIVIRGDRHAEGVRRRGKSSVRSTHWSN